jgi:hypothetical protein
MDSAYQETTTRLSLIILERNADRKGAMRIGLEGFPAETPSPAGWQKGLASADGTPVQRGTDVRGQGQEVAGKGPKRSTAASQDSLELSPEARQQVDKLKARDQQVRAHEAAHMAAGGSLVRGGASYTYQTGPDGKRYAVGGEVSLDASPVPDNPRATIAKAERIRAAALAPAEPSGQDRAVAAKAAVMAAQAATELAQQKPSGQDGATAAEPGRQIDLIG